ncbi:hypothetical protein [Cryobacterium sp. BB736]|uniref:hypothetical protein n=1 Tax=Cryobacterium sp. BB736 TaxID=2746963 RepID=UPI0018768B16|nr:hypothetical protein [Cryobacterium sp. BB736]
MSDHFADGTVARVPNEPSPHNVYVRDGFSGWDDRVWWQAGSEIPVALPPGYELLFEADHERAD